MIVCLLVVSRLDNIHVNWKDVFFFFEADLLSNMIIPTYIAIASTRTIEIFFFCSGDPSNWDHDFAYVFIFPFFQLDDL
jgi:hypothetical protein